MSEPLDKPIVYDLSNDGVHVGYVSVVGGFDGSPAVCSLNVSGPRGRITATLTAASREELTEMVETVSAVLRKEQ